jgi:hypothetical protein
MKSTFNPKYAIYAFFLIEILSSLAFILTRYSFSNFIVLFSNIATASICFYFVCLKNEYITTVKQKIALCYLGIYNLLREGIIFTLLPIPNKEEYFTFYTTIESIALISHFIAFLVIIWQFSIKKVYKQWLSALYFLPIIFFSIIWMIISIIMVNKDLTRIEYILEFIITWHISYIITYSLMLWLILKAHKQKNEIE